MCYNRMGDVYMNRKKIIIILIFISILLVISGIAVYYLRPVPEFIDVKFYDFQPAEACMIFKKDGYLYYYSDSDDYKIEYKYDKKNRTISYGNRKMKIVAYNPDYTYLIVDIDRGIDSAGGFESDNKTFRALIDGSSNHSKKPDYPFVIRKDGSFEGVYKDIDGWVFVFKTDNTCYTYSEHFKNKIHDCKYYLGCFGGTDVCDAVAVTGLSNSEDVYFLDDNFIRPIDSDTYSDGYIKISDSADDLSNN